MQHAGADCLQKPLQDGKGGGEGFEVQKYGDGRVALIGAASSPVHVLLCNVSRASGVLSCGLQQSCSCNTAPTSLELEALANTASSFNDPGSNIDSPLGSNGARHAG